MVINYKLVDVILPKMSDKLESKYSLHSKSSVSAEGSLIISKMDTLTVRLANSEPAKTLLHLNKLSIKQCVLVKDLALPFW